MRFFRSLKNPVAAWAMPLIVVIIVAVDFMVRRAALFSPEKGELLAWSAQYLVFYTFSALMSLSLLILIRSLFLKILPRFPALGRAALFLLMIVWSFLCTGTWEYYRYFSIIPTIYTFEFMGMEPGETRAAVLSSMGPAFLCRWVLFSLLLVALFLIHLKNRRPSGWRFRAPLLLSAAMTLTGLLVFNNNLRFVDQCLTPDVNAVVTAFKAGFDRRDADYFNRAGMHAGNRPALPPLKDPVPFHTLVILNESLRRNNLPCYGYGRDNMPHLKKRMAGRPGEFFVFRRAFANAATTMVAFPTFLAGATSVIPGLTLHALPLFWDYGKAAGCFTACVSSHLYEWRNLMTFLKTPSLDLLFCKETSPYDRINSGFFGIDDRHTFGRLQAAFEEAVSAGKPFFGLLHTFDTHFPYYAPDSLKKFSGPLGDYDNAVLYLDANLEGLFRFMEEKGLWENTVILFTSDHGEAFGEHGVNGHITNLFMETVSVPLWIRIPGALQPRLGTEVLGANLSKPVIIADLVPTCADLMGFASDSSVFALSRKGGGLSLLREIPPGRELVMTNNTEYSVHRDNDFISCATGDTLFHCFTESGRPVLLAYDLNRDSLCTDDVWENASPDYKRKMLAILGSHPNTRPVLSRTAIGPAMQKGMTTE